MDRLTVRKGCKDLEELSLPVEIFMKGSMSRTREKDLVDSFGRMGHTTQAIGQMA